ncbi:SRPBCC domain-containing protein [Cryobacterium frigoriphilum]|uniref:SRPBCC domain-containing protein n=1 Tax=Cryobacterium frigoriphilum TaxID=1259150 RepID=A0A4V3IRA8_9MICO|nr:SRPBCC domain-containing protein [Cryobacterium frigoriphilum]TFD50288.1 SRPBCC domain-containing protein [Cryobacterium frigoriphilum]
MSAEFEIAVEREFPATPEQVWQAVTAETSAWLFPSEDMTGEELVFERPTHHVNRMEGPDGWFNQLEQIIEPRPNGRSFMRWQHSGVFPGDPAEGDDQEDGIRQHTVFYLHTLAEYLEHFTGRPVVFADIPGPESSMAPDSFEVLRAALGVAADAPVGAAASAAMAGLDGAIVDYNTANFIGLRTDAALYRFFGRNAFGGPVGMTVHHFAGAAAETLAATYQEWLTGLYAA